MIPAELTSEIYSAISVNTRAAFSDLLRPSFVGRWWSIIAWEVAHIVHPDDARGILLFLFVLSCVIAPVTGGVFGPGVGSFLITCTIGVMLVWACKIKCRRWEKRWMLFANCITHTEHSELIVQLAKYPTQTELKVSEFCSDRNLNVRELCIDYKLPYEIKQIASDDRSEKVNGYMHLFAFEHLSSSLSYHAQNTCDQVEELRVRSRRKMNEELLCAQRRKIAQRFDTLAGAENKPEVR